MLVGVLGNHTAPYCTESELDWTFERLGHRVVKFQENFTTTDEIFSRCIDEHFDLFVYVHTHGWHTPGTRTVAQLIQDLKPWVKTAGFHLDLYWGLNYSDRRQDRIGQHPFWNCDYVFTADGSHQEEFKARGVNHYWLPPAVVERGCFKGEFQARYAAVDVAFVGSRSYHSEYPFRERLIAWLEQTYGAGFRRINGDQPGGVLRESALNDFYASAKVVVGDCCFSGMPKYWSDRAPETIGRGGFLIHPQVEGLNIPGLVTFAPQNLNDLRERIDFYLDPVNEAERIARRDEATAWVWKHETYTQRVQEMLRIMELN